jgi:hypothetical protein
MNFILNLDYPLKLRTTSKKKNVIRNNYFNLFFQTKVDLKKVNFHQVL